MIYKEQKMTLSDAAKSVNMNEVFIPTNETELAADLQDPEIKMINGKPVMVIMATVVGRDEFMMLSYSKLKRLFAKNNWDEDVIMIFSFKEYKEAYNK